VHLRAWVAANPGEIMEDTWQEKEPMQVMLAAAGRSYTNLGFRFQLVGFQQC
jgi:hypothetical protein